MTQMLLPGVPVLEEVHLETNPQQWFGFKYDEFIGNWKTRKGKWEPRHRDKPEFVLAKSFGEAYGKFMRNHEGDIIRKIKIFPMGKKEEK